MNADDGEKQLQVAVERHRAAIALRVENLKGAITLGGQTVKSLEIVNGGAAIAILTFYGNALTKNPAVIQHLDTTAIGGALIVFGVGVFLAVLCSVLAYLSQLETATRDRVKVEETLRIGAVAVGGLSGLMFLIGAILAGVGIV